MSGGRSAPAFLQRLLDRLTRRAAELAARAGPAAADTAAAERAIAAGNRAEAAGRIAEACLRYREAVAAAPGYARAHLNLGIGLEAAGDAEGALGAYRAALALDADDPYANYNLGKLLHVRGEQREAERHLRAALARKPDFPEARVVLSSVLDAAGGLAAAAGELELALRLRPGDAGTLYNYGVVLRKQRRMAEAEDALKRALAADPGFSPAYRALGGVLHRQSRLAEALEVYAEGRRRDPESADLESSELFALNSHDGISAEALFARHRAFGERLEKRHPARFEPFRNDRNPERRLRIGYVSGDLYFHPVTLFLLPVLDRRDRSAYEVYCYSTGESADELTRRMPAHVDVWRDAAALSDGELADAINADGVDVLVDLSGHSGRQRLAVFAQQPAPVQATWLGYLNTTGLARMRWRVTDRYADPPGATEHLQTETLVRLPHSQWCYRPFVSIDAAAAPPLARNGFVTFGSFNDVSKISASTLELWTAILARLPGSRLVVVGGADGHPGTRITAHFAAAGIDAGRIEMLPRVALDEYFACFNRVDMALDTTPHSGGTTTLDTLWMGVPVVTFPGPRSASRSAASILATAGLGEWVARDAADYVRLALEFARDGATLARLRGSLRERLRQSPLMDEALFARDLERAWRQMWRTWCGAR